MYKRAAKLWSGIRILAGKFGPPSRKKGGSAASAGRRAAKAFLNNQKVPCRVCGDSIVNDEMSDHLFSVHRLATCKYCKESIESHTLYQHIETKHGKKIFETWLRNKPKKSKAQKKVELKIRKESEAARESIHPTGEETRCEFCNLMVDVASVSIHQNRYCKNLKKY